MACCDEAEAEGDVGRVARIVGSVVQSPHITTGTGAHVSGDDGQGFVRTKEPSMRESGNKLRLATVLVAVSMLPGVANAASTITGTVTFDGKVPNLRPLAMDADPACAKKHSGPVANEM